jgi:alkylation response protein AidB-like acyl-CoA dehydrogenase
MVTPLDDQTRRMVADTVSRFVDEAYEPHARRARLNAAAIDYRLHWGMLAELGVLSLPFEEGEGGMSGSAVDVAEVVHVLARGLVLEPFVETAVIAGRLLVGAASGRGRTEELTALVGGEDVTVLVGGRAGIEESLRAYREADGWRLDGLARAVMYAAEADHWLVAAREQPSGDPLVLRVARADVAARVDAFRLMDGRSAADVGLDGVVVGPRALCLRGAAATAALQSASYHATSAYCADAVGCMSQLVEQTGQYLRTRVQFGVAIGTFQALQHRFADMHMAFVEARAIARALAASLDEAAAERKRWLRFAAAAVVTAAGAKVGHEAIQMHGGMGVTDELNISHYNARLVTLARLLRNMVPPDPTLPPLARATDWL